MRLLDFLSLDADKIDFLAAICLCFARSTLRVGFANHLSLKFQACLIDDRMIVILLSNKNPALNRNGQLC